MAWPNGYTYRKQIILTGYTGAGTNFQVKLSIGNSSGGNFNLVGHCTSFPNDIIFTDSGGNTQLSYWIEDMTANPITAWVKVTDDLGSNRNIYIYYGKSAVSQSNGTNTFIFFDDFSGDLSKWTIHKAQGVYPRIETGILVCGNGITSGEYGHTILGSKATYTGFSDNVIEFKHIHTTSAIGEVSFRGNFVGNTGYKGRWDARSGTEQVFLAPPYAGWANIGVAVTKWISASTWYRGKMIIHGSTLELYDNDALKQSMTDTTYSSAGEISLQNHYGVSTSFDDVRVRKYNSPEPVYSSSGGEETSTFVPRIITLF
jgi:hypothetical protein